MAEATVISTSALIAKFQQALDEKWGYIYGKTHEKWDATKQANYARAKAGDSDCANSIKYGPKWYGHWVTDCSGLFAWAFSQLGGYMYHGSNTMYNSYCTAKGQLQNGKRTDGNLLKPGTAVFCYNESTKRYSHVGLYIGNGTVIEAMGAQYGVTTSKVTNSKWENWGELKGVNYGAPQPDPKPDPKPEKGYAIVTGTRLALRTAPATSAKIIMRVDTGETVKLTDPPPSDWVYVTYNGKKGYMMRKYLKEG